MNWWQTVLIGAAFVILTAMASFALIPGCESAGESLSLAWEELSAQPLLIVMNLLPLVLVFLLLQALFCNIFWAGGLLFFAVSLLSYANKLKTVMRSDPLTPQDVQLLREAIYAVKDFDISVSAGLILGLAALALAFVALGIFVKNRKPQALRRMVFIVLALILCIGAEEAMYNAGHYSARYIYYHKLTRTDDANHAQNYKEMGFIYSFLYNRNAYGFTKPESFSKEEAAAWESGDTNAGAEGSDVSAAGGAAVKPHIIMVMCEAFCDITNNDVFLYDEENDPLKNYNSLSAVSANVISGHIVVPNVNAGTANTEFDVMTGTQTKQLADGSIPFFSIRKDTKSIAGVLADEGYATLFTHPGRDWYYNRQNVYDYFGFDELVFSEGYEGAEYAGSLVTDKSVGDFLISSFEEHTAGSEDPFYSFAVTIQNHMPYTADRYGRDASDAPEAVPLARGISADAEETLGIYIEGLRAGDELLGQLTDYFSELEEPVLVMFFGDHLPSLGEDFAVYKELGLTVGSDATYEETLSTYETPYIIWGNDAAAKQCDFAGVLSELTAETAWAGGDEGASGSGERYTISANYLGAMLLELAGFGEDDPYFAFLNAARAELPVLWGDVAVAASAADDGSTVYAPAATSEISDEQSEIVREMACWGYYRMKYAE